MLLYIVRHAHAGKRGDPQYPDDSLRPLSKEGRKRFNRAVKLLVRQGFHPPLVATSPLVRCKQTAKIIARRAIERPDLAVRTELAPGSNLERLIEWTNKQRVDSVAWVGHSPDVEEMISELLGCATPGVRMAKGAVAAIEFAADAIQIGAGQLCWAVNPTILGA